MFCTVTINIMMGPNGFLQFIGYNHARTLRARSTGEHHDSCTSIGVSGLAGQILVTK